MCSWSVIRTHTRILKGQQETRSGTQTFPAAAILPINTDQFSSSSSPDCLCGSQVYASGYQLATVCPSSGSQALSDTHLRLVHTRHLTHSRFHRWEFTALIATTANHITAQHCFTMTTHYSMLHFIQLGLPRLKIQHTKAVGRERVFWGYEHRQRSVNRPWRWNMHACLWHVRMCKTMFSKTISWWLPWINGQLIGHKVLYN